MSLTFDFDHSVDRIFSLLTDPDFLVERSTALGELEADCEVDYHDDATVVQMTRKTKHDIPALLARVFDPVQTLKMEEVWRRDGDNWEGEYEIKIVGQPVTIRANFTLMANGKGARYDITHSCRAKIPLLGGKIEKMVLSQTGEGATRELEYVRKHLK